MCKRCAESVQPLSYIEKERQILQFNALSLVHLQGLEPWAHWLREQVAGSSQKMEVSSYRYFYTKQRDFLYINFCTLCRILHRKVSSAQFETVQKPCTYSKTNKFRPIPYRLDGIGLSDRTSKSSHGGSHIEQSIFFPLHHRDNRNSPASLLFRIFLLKSFLSKTPVETLSEADASSAYPKVFNWSIYFCISSSVILL